MKVKCDNCGAKFKLHDSKIPPQGLRMECPRCGSAINVSSPGPGATDADSDDALPAAPSAAGMAPPPPPPSFDDFDLGLDKPLESSRDLPPEMPDFDLPPTKSDDGDLEKLLEGALGEMEDDFPLDQQEDDSIVTPPPASERKSASRFEKEEKSSFDFDMIDDLPTEAPPILGDDFMSDKSSSDDGFDIASLLEDAAGEVGIEMEKNSPRSGGVSNKPEAEAEEEVEPLSGDDLFDLGSEGMVDVPDDVPSPSKPAQSTPEKGKAPISLDMLDDIPDVSGKGVKAGLFYLRSGGGKVLGPFPEKVVIEMIEAGKLNGKEEAKGSDNKWLALTDVAQFKAALDSVSGSEDIIEPLMPTKTQKILSAEDRKKLKTDTTKRRRAGSLDVISPKKAPRKKIPLKLAVPFLVLLLLLGVVSYLQVVEEISVIDMMTGTSVYDLPMLEQLKSRHRERYDQALSKLSEDSPKAYSEARELAVDMLKGGDFRGSAVVNALVAELDFEIMRRFGGSMEISTEANEHLAQIDKTGKAEPEFLLAHASQEFWRHDYEKARELLQKVLVQRPQDVRALQVAAETFLFLPDKTPAQKYLEKIIEAKAATVRTYYLMGRLEAEKGDKTAAENYYKKALEINPRHIDSKIELAGLMITPTGAMHKAERDLRQLEADEKGNLAYKQEGLIHFYLAQIYDSRKEPYKVVKELTAASEKDPTNPLYNRTLADFYFTKREYAKAGEQYESCVTNNPNEIDCHIGLGRNYLAMNRPDKSLFKMEGAIKIAPSNAELAYLMGQSLEGLFQPDKALEQYQKAINLDPNGVAYYTAAASIYLQRNDLLKAGEFIQKAKLIDAASPLVHNFLGLMHISQKEMDLAEEQFLKAIESDKEFLDAHLNLANVYRDLRRFEDAIREYQEVLSLDEKSDQAYYGMGRTYFVMNEIEKAVAEYEKALGLNKNNYEYFFHAGLAYFNLYEKLKSGKRAPVNETKTVVPAEAALPVEGEAAPQVDNKPVEDDIPQSDAMLKKALEAFTRASELAPKHPESQHWIGRCYSEMNRFEEANEHYERALTLDPENPVFIYHLGYLLEKQDKQEDAIEQYDRAVSIKEDYAEAYLRKGIVLRRQNKYINAIKMFRKASHYNPSLNMSRLEQGDCYIELNQIDQAMSFYKEALKQDPNDPRAHFKISRAFMEQRKFKDAITHLQRGLSLDPNNADAYLRLGWSLKWVKRYGEAIKAFKRYLELEPQAIDKADIEQQIQFMQSKDR